MKIYYNTSDERNLGLSLIKNKYFIRIRAYFQRVIDLLAHLARYK